MIRLSEISDLLSCDVCTPGDGLDGVEINFGCASDLMSDVLAFSRAGSVLLTGLVTVQTIQTAYIAEIGAVVFVRGKKPGEAIIELAREKRIAVLATPFSMYEACGLLYRKGLPSTMEKVPGVAHHDDA